VYTWKCSRDTDQCWDTADLDWQGWLAFTILMVAHILKDVINGAKVVVLSGKARHSIPTRIRLFVGGTILVTISVFTFYVSAIYNNAIATSNTEMIVNSVVILFICDVDELTYDILVALNPGWVENMSYQEQDNCFSLGDENEKGPKCGGGSANTDSESNAEEQEGGQRLESEVRALRETVDML